MRVPAQGQNGYKGITKIKFQELQRLAKFVPKEIKKNVLRSWRNIRKAQLFEALNSCKIILERKPDLTNHEEAVLLLLRQYFDKREPNLLPFERNPHLAELSLLMNCPTSNDSTELLDLARAQFHLHLEYPDVKENETEMKERMIFDTSGYTHAFIEPEKGLETYYWRVVDGTKKAVVLLHHRLLPLTSFVKKTGYMIPTELLVWRPKTKDYYAVKNVYFLGIARQQKTRLKVLDKNTKIVRTFFLCNIARIFLPKTLLE